MPFVKANCVCFIANTLRREGEVFEYNGRPNRNVDPVGPAPREDAPAPEPETPVAEAPKLKLRRGPRKTMD